VNDDVAIRKYTYGTLYLPLLAHLGGIIFLVFLRTNTPIAVGRYRAVLWRRVTDRSGVVSELGATSYL